STSIRFIAPLMIPLSSRNASSHRAMMSTMALPMHRTSNSLMRNSDCGAWMAGCSRGLSPRQTFAKAWTIGLAAFLHRSRRRHPMAHVFLGAFGGQSRAGDDVIDRLGDVGGVVADAFDVLGAEDEMRAGGDVTRVFHHIGEKFPEQRSVHGVDVLVAVPHEADLVRQTRGIGVKHFLEL